ncbi:HAMP domain-containing sensor histidine kinase [Kiritimatiellaeota bacterium B1221]|nr:HAMP domain-containing sensor histidine kinase [Kiritimatiellaeota bacterium B1221]
MKLPTNSIRWHLQIWYASLLLIALAGLSFTVLRLSRIHRIRQLDQQITDQQRFFFKSLFPEKKLTGPSAESNKPAPPDPKEIYRRLQAEHQNPTSEILQAFSGTEPGFFYFAISDRDGSILLSSKNFPEGFVFPSEARGEDFDTQYFKGTYREHLRRGPPGIRVYFGMDASEVLKEMDQFAVSITLFAAGIWLVGLAGGWWIVGRALRPVQEISATAVAIAEGNLDQRIEWAGNQSELNQLAQVLNHTFDELASAMERQRQFTGNASHELRTPLTVILSETQRMLKRDRAPGEYRESMEICQQAGLRMKVLVEGLLLLARQENQNSAESRMPCNLQNIVEQSLNTLGHLAAERDMKIITDLASAPLVADAAALRILVDNLVENAISHHPGGGTVTLTLKNTEPAIQFEVADDGPGIDPAYHDKIFERFYQLDTSRSRGGGHSGLGLALVKRIAENHQGTCSLHSAPGKGSRFTVQFSKQTGEGSASLQI